MKVKRKQLFSNMEYTFFYLDTIIILYLDDFSRLTVFVFFSFYFDSNYFLSFLFFSVSKKKGRERIKKTILSCGTVHERILDEANLFFLVSFGWRGTSCPFREFMNQVVLLSLSLDFFYIKKKKQLYIIKQPAITV